MIMLLGGAGCEASQTLEDSGLIKDSGQALGATGLRSVRWKHIYTCIYKTYTPFFFLEIKEESTAACVHTTCACSDH
jgi:hypothetical protein